LGWKGAVPLAAWLVPGAPCPQQGVRLKRAQDKASPSWGTAFVANLG